MRREVEYRYNMPRIMMNQMKYTGGKGKREMKRHQDWLL